MGMVGQSLATKLLDRSCRNHGRAKRGRRGGCSVGGGHRRKCRLRDVSRCRGARRAHLQLHGRIRFARGAPCGGSGEPVRQAPHRRRQPARLLARHAAEPLRDEHRQPGRGDSAHLPRRAVVKALDTINDMLMVDPAPVAGEHDVVICGDDAEAKAEVRSFSRASAGRPTASATSAISLPHVPPRATYRYG